jgi:hypothetical protein
MVADTAYRDLDLNAAAKVMRAPALVDARGFFEPDNLWQAGFIYRLIGVGDPSNAHEGSSERP